jgi:hypothetical protein
MTFSPSSSALLSAAWANIHQETERARHPIRQDAGWGSRDLLIVGFPLSLYAAAMTVPKALGVWLLAAVLFAGCKSTNPDTLALSSIVLRGNTPGQINHAVEQVFSRHGFKKMNSTVTTMVLEKKAPLSTDLAYGGWMSTITIRVKTKIVPMSEGVYRLECNAARVEDAGQNLEEERKMGRSKHKEFDKLLQEVAVELGNPPPPE